MVNLNCYVKWLLHLINIMTVKLLWANQHCLTLLAILKGALLQLRRQGACMSVYVCMYMYFKVLGSTSLNLLAFKYSTSTWSFFKKYLSNYRVLHYLCLSVLISTSTKVLRPKPGSCRSRLPIQMCSCRSRLPIQMCSCGSRLPIQMCSCRLTIKTPDPDVQRLQVDKNPDPV